MLEAIIVVVTIIGWVICYFNNRVQKDINKHQEKEIKALEREIETLKYLADIEKVIYHNHEWYQKSVNVNQDRREPGNGC